MSEVAPFHPTPNGVRDMLPTELRELGTLLEPIRKELEGRDFKEIHTPALEYESVMALGNVESTEPAFRLMDDEGRMLVLRSDMTIPTVRLVTTRLRDEPPPFRFYYVSHIYRGKAAPGRSREFLQLGAELIGRSGLSATVELLETMVAALDAAGLTEYSVVMGHASLFPRLMKTLEIPAAAREELGRDLAGRNFVAMGKRLEQLQELGAISAANALMLRELAQTRGAAAVVDQLPEAAKDVVADLTRLAGEASEAVRARLVFDFGMSPNLDYYNGEIFEVHHPAAGEPIGGGGRYDELLTRFGRPLEALGFGLSVEQLHTVKLAEDAEGKVSLESSEETE